MSMNKKKSNKQADRTLAPIILTFGLVFSGGVAGAMAAGYQSDEAPVQEAVVQEWSGNHTSGSVGMTPVSTSGEAGIAGK